MTHKELHAKLLSLIISHPATEAFQKKHGKWLKLDVDSGEFFQVDTWNKSIHLKRGDGVYNRWTGFNGEVLRHCGGNFGGFYYAGTTEQLKHAVALAASMHRQYAPEVG